jgi:hypothetical protein
MFSARDDQTLTNSIRDVCYQTMQQTTVRSGPCKGKFTQNCLHMTSASDLSVFSGTTDRNTIASKCTQGTFSLPCGDSIAEIFSV